MAVTRCAICAYRVPGQRFQDGLGARLLCERTESAHIIPGRSNRSGFTLIELLVVVAIVAILASIMFPVFTNAKESARRAQCLSNLKQLTAAWTLYANDNNTRACPSYRMLTDGTMYSWDFTYKSPNWTPGLLASYTRAGAIYRCPSFKQPSNDRPFTGYAYNASYIGGDPSNVEPCKVESCFLGQIARPGATVVFADGGYGTSTMVKPHNYLRAPSDTQMYPAGTVHYRHNGMACAAFADGHVSATNKEYLPNKKQSDCGALSPDDSAYDLQ
jgi:prepilin-type N-terminal cleavage/methylation domain-containing protein/prepilin-type processing-associated H-X9-DG protein